MKLFFTFDKKTKEGFESVDPRLVCDFDDGCVEEIQGEGVIERVYNLIEFINECDRLLVPGGKMVFSAPYYASTNSWAHPDTKRGVSEATLNFANKNWRDQNNCSAITDVDYEVTGAFALSAEVLQRSEDAKHFWMQKYNNVAQAVIFTLIKKDQTDK